ncbi:MAG: gamma-glutamyl-gamma-aminobutyrate hydrolase family protein [Acidobacteria bacterium]|nr:gamma-glutamyl-gamma-aminobutyrate hydrolase family protein [Acidobacteriota bacterium]
MASRPRIGITTRLELETGRFYLGRHYSEAVWAAGGVPVMLPLIAEKGFIDAAVSTLDGLLLPGSDTDPDPARYGEEPAIGLKKVIFEKDETDRLAILAADQLGLPILGICFGMQILNVVRGGSLVQDIPSEVPKALKHEQGMPLERLSHRIDIENGSVLAEIASAEDGERRVNSHHHQSVKAVGSGLQISARAADGVIEAVEGTDRSRFQIGVQWHPELCWGFDRFSRELFEQFVEACHGRTLEAGT